MVCQVLGFLLFERGYQSCLYVSCDTIKPTKWHVHLVKTQISLGIRPVCSESSLSAWRKIGSLATHWGQAKTLIRLDGCPGWSESSLGTQSFCWFWHEVAHVVKGDQVVSQANTLFHWKKKKCRELWLVSSNRFCGTNFVNLMLSNEKYEQYKAQIKYICGSGFPICSIFSTLS